jgi:hypothetical protein
VKRAALLFLALSACAARSDVHKYDNSLFVLGSAFAAKQACSCLFVAQRTEDECRAWVRVSPDVARFHVDWDERSVRARALGMGRTDAHFVDDQLGCVIDD